MWKCPKCGRSFSREGQGHYCGKIETVDQYIEEQAETIRPYLNEVRQIIRSAIPEAQEKIPNWIIVFIMKPSWDDTVRLRHISGLHLCE